MILAVAIPTLAGNDKNNGNNGNVGTTNVFTGSIDVKVDKNNANFHCDTFGGNGRVWPEEAIDAIGKVTEHDFKKSPFTFVFSSVEGTTKWLLEDVKDSGTSVGLPVCPECGSTLWVSFSNNSGAPDGKNIQLQHPTVDIEIVKVWLDANGEVIKSPKDLSAKFGFDYIIGAAKPASKTVSPGTISVPAGKYTVNEMLDKLPKNYTLIDAASETFDIDNFVGNIEISPAMALAGGKYKITYTNKEDPYAIIEKVWFDKDGNKVAKPAGVEAVFDIYEFEGYEDDGYTPIRGDRITDDKGLLPNVKFYIEPGIYIVGEREKEGYLVQPDQVIEVKANEIGKCLFENVPFDPKGSLSFEKKVEDTNIVTWLNDKELDTDNILDGLEFYLDGIGIDGKAYTYGPVTPDYLLGAVEFDNVYPGTYTLSEEITGAAVSIFKKMADIEINIFDGDNKHFVIGGSVVGGFGIEDFDFDALYKVDCKHLNYWDYLEYDDYRYEIFYIGITNSENKDQHYASFCANPKSATFAGLYDDCEGYIVADPATYGKLDNYDEFISAFNYIKDNYGDLSENRHITQTVVWALLGAIDIESAEWKNIGCELKNDDQGEEHRYGLTGEEKDAVEDILNKSKGYMGKGDITALVYMVCENSSHDAIHCQPQIVPLYGKFYVENKPEEEIVVKGTLNATFVISGTRDIYEWTYKEEPNTKSASGSITADARGSTDHNWFGGVWVNVEEAKENPVKVEQLRTGNSDKGDIIETGYEISVDEDGYVWIDLLDIVTASASVQLLPINSQGKGIQNNNGHHVNVSGKFNTELYVGDLEEAFVYIHFGSLTYYDGTTSWVKDELVFFESEDVEYDGTLNLLVINEDGVEIFNDEPDFKQFFGYFVIPGEFPAGKYFATLSGDGFDDIERDVEIIDKGEYTFNFESVTITYPDLINDPGAPNA